MAVWQPPSASQSYCLCSTLTSFNPSKPSFPSLRTHNRVETTQARDVTATEQWCQPRGFMERGKRRRGRKGRERWGERGEEKGKKRKERRGRREEGGGRSTAWFEHYHKDKEPGMFPPLITKRTQLRKSMSTSNKKQSKDRPLLHSSFPHELSSKKYTNCIKIDNNYGKHKSGRFNIPPNLSSNKLRVN